MIFQLVVVIVSRQNHYLVTNWFIQIPSRHSVDHILDAQIFIYFREEENENLTIIYLPSPPLAVPMSVINFSIITYLFVFLSNYGSCLFFKLTCLSLCLLLLFILSLQIISGHGQAKHSLELLPFRRVMSSNQVQDSIHA